MTPSTRALELFDNGCKGEHMHEWCEGPEMMQAPSGIFGFEFHLDDIETIRTALTDNQRLVEALQKCIKEYKQLNILFLEHGFNRSVNDVKETIEYLENVIANYKEKNHV